MRAKRGRSLVEVQLAGLAAPGDGVRQVKGQAHGLRDAAVAVHLGDHAELVRFAEKIVRKHLTKNQPDYLDAYDAVINGFVFFLYGIHITRRNIFNAYCEWLFSFIIDATEEIRDKVEILGKSLEEMRHDYSRMPGFFCERLFTVWLIKNHLRIKTLPIMFREDV